MTVKMVRFGTMSWEPNDARKKASVEGRTCSGSTENEEETGIHHTYSALYYSGTDAYDANMSENDKSSFGTATSDELGSHTDERETGT